ncbi:hypothetical protein TcasGA2_TC031684 [Tribolium castaneum]|uniref:Uncharacterized protein n=1 Tax=Tribolium castaneum TaxID=7070 RepID=A0A139W8P9_TRICA|nr:hypothetical protein TcasGA2_TC031684 [Tribolium castaneum]
MDEEIVRKYFKKLKCDKHVSQSVKLFKVEIFMDEITHVVHGNFIMKR